MVNNVAFFGMSDSGYDFLHASEFVKGDKVSAKSLLKQCKHENCTFLGRSERG